MQAPTTTDLLKDSVVRQAIEQAWTDSLPGDATLRHEEGGWIYAETATGSITVRRAPSGTQASVDLNSPPALPGFVVVATFHTHPNPSADGWEAGPSIEDTQSAWQFGVPCLIRADDGIHFTGPVSRRGGLAGGAGYPA